VFLSVGNFLVKFKKEFSRKNNELPSVVELRKKLEQ